jgi:hypothetical protein
LPPLDEHGVPKYKGKKRGRKPKVRRRKINPNRRKRQHTAYTIFVKETYPGIKESNPQLASKDIIAIVARQWKHQVTPEEKQAWKQRAQETHIEEEVEVGPAGGAAAGAVEGMDEDEEDEDAVIVDEEEDDEGEDEEEGDEDEDLQASSRRSKRGKQ